MRTFAQLFQGRADCFGTYRVFEESQSGKQKGKAVTYPNDRQPDRVLTDGDWDAHLAGKQRLGIVPILPDGTCGWFAIDIDDYSVNQHQVVVDIERKELPLVVCRSKSGGAHLYCFINGSIEASLGIELGTKWAEMLGFKGSEVFPKQSSLDYKDAIGNWIICPYFKGDKAADFAYGIQGERLSLDEFVQWANAKQISPEEAAEYLKKKEQSAKDMTDDEIWAQSPPCIQWFRENGVSEGGRNNLFGHMCVYYQKKDALLGTDNWKNDAVEFINSYSDEPLGWEETNHTIQTHTRKEYQYHCKNQPMAAQCNNEACLKLILGVGPDRSFYGDVEITSMIKIDSKPPIWIPRINGKDIEMNTDTLLSPRKFKFAIADALNILMPGMVQITHDAIIGPVMSGALTIEPLDELTPEGKTMSVFQEWTGNLLSKSKSLEDLQKGLPINVEDDNSIYFRGQDFLAEYRRVYKDNMADRDIWAALRRGGFQRKRLRSGKKVSWIWLYPLEEGEEWFDINTGDAF